MLLLAEGAEQTRETVDEHGEPVVQVVRKGMAKEQVDAELARLAADRRVAMGP